MKQAVRIFQSDHSGTSSDGHCIARSRFKWYATCMVQETKYVAYYLVAHYLRVPRLGAGLGVGQRIRRSIPVFTLRCTGQPCLRGTAGLKVVSQAAESLPCPTPPSGVWIPAVLLNVCPG